jgi:glycosyltransferase involved in cell wall biosynthesis
MLLGRPCVVNRKIPAAGGLVDDGINGYVVDGRTVEDYCRALRDFSTLSVESRVAMGEAARSRAMDYSYEKHLTSIVASLRYASSRRRAFANTRENAELT